MLPHEPSSFRKDHVGADFKTIKLYLYHQTQNTEVHCMLSEQHVYSHGKGTLCTGSRLIVARAPRHSSPWRDSGKPTTNSEGLTGRRKNQQQSSDHMDETTLEAMCNATQFRGGELNDSCFGTILYHY